MNACIGIASIDGTRTGTDDVLNAVKACYEAKPAARATPSTDVRAAGRPGSADPASTTPGHRIGRVLRAGPGRWRRSMAVPACVIPQVTHLRALAGMKGA
jgi:hypothetical protein